MKIIFISNFLPDTNYTRDLSQGFIQVMKDKDSLFLCGRSNEPVLDGKKPDVDLVWRKGTLFFIPILLYILKKRPNLIHFQQEFKMYGGILSALFLPWLILLIRLFGIKIVVTSHGIVSTRQLSKEFLKSFGLKDNLSNRLLITIFLRYSYTLLVAFSNKLTVHAPMLRKILVEEYKCNPNKIDVIEHGIREIPKLNSVHKESVIKRFPLLKNKDIILVFGYFSPRKGFEFLVESFSEMIKKNKKNKWVMVLAGDVAHEFEPYKKKIEKLIKKLKSERAIIITGFIDANGVDELYRAARVSVIPALFSFNTSGALSLSLAYKKPLLAANVKPIADEIQNNNIGRLFENADINSFSQELNNLFLNENYQQIMSSVNKVAARRLWKEIAKDHYKLYQEI